MSSEARLYKFSDATKDHLRKFRLGTSRATSPQAVIYLIDKATHEIRQDGRGRVYATLDDVADDLPDHAPRFVLLSYPLTLDGGRMSVPYVLLFYLPVTCNSKTRMLYAGAKELMRNTAETARIVDLENAEELEGLPDKLKSSAA